MTVIDIVVIALMAVVLVVVVVVTVRFVRAMRVAARIKRQGGPLSEADRRHVAAVKLSRDRKRDGGTDASDGLIRDGL